MRSGQRPFGLRLKALRESAGFTQEELAAISGLSVHAVSSLERGERRRPHLETVRALSAALDLDPAARDAFAASARAPAVATAVDEFSTVPLPVPPTALVGRDADLQLLHEWLRDPAARLITLIGPGGVGKTRLALEVARGVADEGATRVALVALAAVSDASFVAAAIADELGLGDVAAHDLAARARVACEERPTLLVLDNFEHLLDVRGLVAELLVSVQGLRLLVTSRAPLHVRGEREYAVGPLALSADAAVLPPGELARCPAVQLFVDRVRDVQPGFRLTAANAPVVAAICRRLDALPLAIELAAPWIKALAVRGLLRRLEQNVLLSSVAPHDLPARQQTMNATVAWSYQLLGADEQRAFRRFGALPGLFPMDAAASVLAGRADVAADSDDAIHAVAGLIDKSLLLRAETSAVPACPVYYMLETVRAYAALELAAAGEREDAMEGLARHAIAAARQAAEGLRGPAQVEWLNRAREDLESHRAALRWLIDAGRAAEACEIAWSLMFFWAIRGHAAEGLRWYEQILQLRPIPDHVEARALLGAGAMRYVHGTLSTARVALAGALTAAEQIGDAALAAQAGNLLGHVEHSLGRVSVARDLYARSVDRFRALGLPWGLGNSLTGMATIHLATGDAATAELLLDEAVAVLPPAGPWFLVLTQHVRALLAVRRGDAEEALAIVRHSLTLIRALHDKYAFVYAMGPLAAAAVLSGDDEWAARIFGARDAVTERTGATAVVRQALDDLMQLAERDVRTRLGPERWALAYDAGQRLSVDALIQDIDRRSRRRPRV